MPLKTRTVALLSALALSLPLVAAAACPEGPAATHDAARAEDAPAEYTIEAATATVRVGAQGHAVVTITTRGGYHWNKEYPAKATVATAGSATLAVKKTEFKSSAGDFDSGETVATLKIPVTGKAAGRETLTVETRFGVCNDKVCLIKKASTDVTVVVAD